MGLRTTLSVIFPKITEVFEKSQREWLTSFIRIIEDVFRNIRLDLGDLYDQVIQLVTDIASLSPSLRVGKIEITQEIRTLSSSMPWYNLANPNEVLDVANLPDYVPYLRGIQAHTKWTSAVLTGTVTLTGTALVGSSTNFDPELTVGDLVFIEKLNQFRYIATRTSDTAATVSEPGTAAAGARIWKITKQASPLLYNYDFPVTAYQITGATSFSLWFNEGSTTKQPENYILMRALAEAYAYDREYGTLTLPEAIGGIPAGDYQITGITLANLGTSNAVITCSASGLTGGAKTASSANISIYPHRIAGSTTTARHKELTDAAIMNDGLYNVLGLAQRDQMQGHWHTGRGGVPGVVSTDIWNRLASSLQTSAMTAARDAYTDTLNETPRTGTRTRPRSGIFNYYAYVGTYVA